MLVCKFLDGPEFLTSRLVHYADGLGLNPRSYSQERDEGYYALHFYATFKVDLLNKEFQAQDSPVELEIQTTTQLQEILKGLTYTYYKESRTQPAKDRSKWKWEYETNRFKAGYLGHTLHLLEALIVQLRDANSVALPQPLAAPAERSTSAETATHDLTANTGQAPDVFAEPVATNAADVTPAIVGETVQAVATTTDDKDLGGADRDEGVE
jgi:hypothetical protein